MPASPASSRPPILDFAGGQACLDFVNTWTTRGRTETEKLRRYEDLIAFARQAGYLSAPAAASLSRRARRRPAAAATALARIVEVREALYRLLVALGADRQADAADLERLNAVLPRALGSLRLAVEPCGWKWEWAASEAGWEAPLGPVLCSAVELLTAGDAARVRECASERCTWLFLDRSRNGSRRWCDMKTCGNRAKARRHYRRHRPPGRSAS